MNCVSLSLREASELLASGRMTSVDMCRAFLDRIRKVEDRVHALLNWKEEDILRQAAESDARRANGKLLSAFDGIPVTLKDNICASG